MSLTDVEAEPATEGRPRPARRSLLAGAGLFAVVVLPLVVALVAMHDPRWYPIADLAQGELRVRDVGTGDTPLIGLAGRIGTFADAGSHPGPLSFWALAPIYRLLGGTAWGLVASSVALHATAVGLVLWMARRRAGLPMVAALAAALALLLRTYGSEVFTEPWNPHLPVLWWVAFLVALWSVLDDDAPMLVVAVVAGSFCAQTHLPYLGLVGALMAFLAVPVALALRPGRGPDRPGADRRGLGRWALGAGALGVVLWIPTFLDEVAGTGNVTKIRESLTDPVEPITGGVAAARQLAFQIDPFRLVGRSPTLTATGDTAWNVPGLLLLVVWAVAAVAAWRWGHRSLVRLHAVLAVALVLAWVSISRVYGELWYYLFLWAWGLMALMVVATTWTAAAGLARRSPPAGAAVRRRVATVVAALVAVVASGTFTVAAIDAEPSRPDLSATLGVVADDTVAALAGGEVPGGGRDGRYLVRWLDRFTIGSQGIGLVNELERAGFTAGVDPPFGPGAARHRVLPLAEATALVQLVVGPDIPEWQGREDTVQVAYVDDRSAARRAEAEDLLIEIDDSLRAAGHDDIAEEWETNLFTSTLNPDIPDAVRAKMLRVLDIGAPVAVFVAPRPER